MTNAYTYIKKTIRENLQKNMIAWREAPAVIRLEKPSDIGKARILGYKDKKGFVILRVKLVRGGRKRETRNKGRRSKRMTIRKTLKMSYRWIAEQRASKKYPNLEVLNSYWVGKDGKHYFFEIIMLDPDAPEILADKSISWIANRKNQGRAFRGLTSAARKSRGLRSKSDMLKVRPSLRSWNRKGK